jgi:hypothetical protein
VINELVAVNSTGVVDPAGNTEDWIELYNTTGNYLSLDNLYLSDDAVTPLKWQFPANTVVAPYSYFMIWADNDAASVNGTHSNFKLSSGGEDLLLSYADGTIVDYVYFSAQSADISYGRYPNATGPFTYLGPTYAATNSHISVPEESISSLKIFPNPSTGLFRITSDEMIGSIQVFSMNGQDVFNATFNSNAAELDLSSLENGVYFLKAGNMTYRVVILK